MWIRWGIVQKRDYGGWGTIKVVSLLARRLKQGLLEWMWRGQKTNEQHLREAESTKFRDSLNVGNAERDRILVDCLSLSFGSSD